MEVSKRCPVCGNVVSMVGDKKIDYPCYVCGADILKADMPIIGADFSFCSEKCLREYQKIVRK